ncbi:hypothetical protein KKE03_00145 [Patescibacteria group bacterium]|nr:hypothetical protein [Patescibacteria group bacterium]
MKIEQRLDPGYPVFDPDDIKQYVHGVNLYRRLEHTPGARPVLIYPPLGNVEVAIEYFAGRLGILTLARFKREYGGDQNSILPSPINDRIIERGVLDSPQTICNPFKDTQGYFLQALDEFASVQSQTCGDFYEFLMTHRSSGYCRERCYGALGELILRDSSQNLHKDFDFYAVHESLPGIWQLISDLSHMTGRNRFGIIKILNEAIERLDMVEKFEDRVRYNQSLAEDYYAPEKILVEAKHQAASLDLTNSKLEEEFVKHLEKVESFRKIREEPIGVVAITGEIFHCEELMRYPSHNLGAELLKRGFYFKREVGLHHYTPRFRLDWKRLAKFALSQINPFRRDITAEEAAAGGLMYDPGGHAKDIVALAERQTKTGEYDGILEIYPFNCSPSVAIAEIVDKILARSKIPYLRVQMDVGAGVAGLITRIEAWLEMIVRKKQRMWETSDTMVK